MENPLYEELGNFRDIIMNIVYKLQQYADEFLSFIPSNISVLEDYHYNIDIIGFLLCEGEEILKNKILRESITIDRELIRKYNNLLKIINNTDEETHIFLVNESYTDYIKLVEKEMNIRNLRYTSYHYNEAPTDPMSVYHFSENTNARIEEYHDMEASESRIKEYTKEEVTKAYLSYYNSSCSRITFLRSLIENSASCYNSAILIQNMINSMLISLTEVLAIEIKEK